MFLYVRNPPEEPLKVKLLQCTSKPNQPSGEIASASFSDIAGLCDGESHELELDLEGWAALALPSGGMRKDWQACAIQVDL